uniref:Uncharacterized protein n=1 Tax=Lepeophtheirus salmonis TaxID=72036 RepID=A0A0K2UVW5_LEPSM
MVTSEIGLNQRWKKGLILQVQVKSQDHEYF